MAVTYKIPLQVAITFPDDGSKLSNTPVFIEGTVSDPTAGVTVNSVKATVLADGRFTANNIPLSEGANTVTATALNWVNETATSTATLNYQATDPAPALSVSITSPAGGATINNEAVTVSGTINSTTQEMSVKVNGILAEIYGEYVDGHLTNIRFNANNVPLANGSNIIIADAMDANGTIARSQITVTANTTAPHVTLSSNIQGGTAPLTAYFNIRTNIQNEITSYQLDFGDGSAPYTGTTFESVSHTYTADGGIFHPMITVTDSLGNVYTDAIAITALSYDVLDAVLKQKWTGMKETMLTGDTDAALEYFADYKKEEYRQVITQLGIAGMNEILSNITTVELDSYYGIEAEAGALCEEPGGVYSYPISFVRDSSGAWKISGF